MADTKLREILPGIFVVHLPLPMKPTIVNVTLLHSGEVWALVDTGIHSIESLDSIEAAMRLAGCRPGQLRAIIATHHHPDHFGASGVLKERTGAVVYMHEREAQQAQQHYRPGRFSDETMAFFVRHGLPMDRWGMVPSAGDFWAQLYQPAEVDHFLVDGEVLRIGQFELEVIETPGHTGGHCVLFLRGERVLIAGDHLLPRITPHVGYYPGGSANPLGDFLASQRKVQPFAVDFVLPAHGGVYSDHRRRANQIIRHHQYRLREMRDLVRNRALTAYEVASEAWGFGIDGPLQVQFPATFESLAHLEFLRLEGRVACEEVDGRIRYRAI